MECRSCQTVLCAEKTLRHDQPRLKIRQTDSNTPTPQKADLFRVHALLSQKRSSKRLTGAAKFEMVLKRYGFEAFVCLQKLCLTFSKIQIRFYEKECNFGI